MFRSELMARLGAAVCSTVSLFAEVNYITETARIITAQDAFAPLRRLRSRARLFESIAELAHTDDRGDFLEMCSAENVVTRFSDGDGDIRCELRCAGENGEYEWYDARFLNGGKESADFDGRVLFLVSNINERKGLEERAEELSKQVERDPLTGLYNQRAAQTLIDGFLEGEGRNGRHTMILCDLDEFKSVNDSLGHPFGDALLTDIAAKISSTFRREDIACRIGGDEFVVLMKNTAGRSYAARRAELLLDRMKQAFPLGECSLNVSTSIGIASYPDCGTTYAELFSCADKAMYLAKTNGKDQYRFYDDTLSDGSRFTHLKPITDVVAAGGTHRSREKIGDYIFSCMYESADIEKTLPLVLQLIGTHFRLNRVFFAELERNDRLRISCQWNASDLGRAEEAIDYSGQTRALFESARACEDMLLSYGEAKDIPIAARRALEEAGVTGIRAAALCPLLDGGEISGYIGLCDCCGPRVWTQEERDTFSYVARLTSLFIFRQRAHERTLRALELNRQVLDSSPVMMYIVDPDTHQLIYVSGRTAEHVPAAAPGRICHEVFLGSTEPCSFCPMNGWKAQGGGASVYTCEVYSEHLNDWTDSSATGITMADGREACLCGCYSVKKYKLRERELEEELARLRALPGGKEPNQ